MKILLVYPPSRSVIKEVLEATSPPLGLAYVASILEREGEEVKIVDSLVDNLTFDDVKKRISAWNPDLVGVSSTTSNIYDALKVAKIAKDLGCKVVLGGVHVTFKDIETLNSFPYVDFIVRGEGEYTTLDLVRTLEKNVEPKEVLGLTYRWKDVVKRNPSRPFIQDLDSLPLPAYHLLPMEKYISEGSRYATMITSRGCPFNCVFCSSSRICGKKWRGRSAEKVADELELLTEKYKVKTVEFLDDTFTLNKKRAEEICDEFVRRKIDIPWACSSRVDTINARLASKLKKASCFVVYLGVESGSQRILNFIKKGITLSQAERAVRLMKKVGLEVLTSFVLGMPDETVEEAEKTIELAVKLNPEYAQFTIATPYPGTELYAYAEKNNMLLTRNWSKYDTLTPVMKTKIGAERLTKLLRKAYFKFYVRLGYLITQLKKRRLILVKKAFLAVRKYVSSALT